MSTICSIGTRLLILLYVVALFLFLVGHFGWFGQERTALAGVFLAPLGLPWNMLFSRAPEPLLPWLGLGAPIINIAILSFLCRRLHG